MNARAAAFLAQHGQWFDLDGQRELMLPLDKIQGFLDLLQPRDVPPETLQKLYTWQAEAVPEITRQLAQKGWYQPDSAEHDGD